jgi:hypothetical protein
MNGVLFKFKFIWFSIDWQSSWPKFHLYLHHFLSKFIKFYSPGSSANINLKSITTRVILNKFVIIKKILTKLFNAYN